MNSRSYLLLASVTVILGSIIIVLAALLATSGRDNVASSQTGSTSSPQAGATPPPLVQRFPEYGQLVAQGKAIFDKAGCPSCHAAGGVGSDTAPALAGHNRRQVISQLLNPLGAMPPFIPSKLSRQDAELVALYVENLGGAGGAHIHPAYQYEPDPIPHLSMAIVALAYNNQLDALHHIRDIIQLSDPTPELIQELNSIQVDIEASRFVKAQFNMQSLMVMLAPQEARTALTKLYSTLALDAMQNGAISAASYLDNLLTQIGGQNGDADTIREAVNLLDEGQYDQAYQKLELIQH
ncbi:MAG: cytochrome c [Chloroflexi bacterium]|nr:cytochrome c [Chloroflexota bacterium]